MAQQEKHMVFKGNVLCLCPLPLPHFAKLAFLQGPLDWLLGPVSPSPPLLGPCLMPGCLDACRCTTGGSAVPQGSQHPWTPS